jgi:hypothetical protein
MRVFATVVLLGSLIVLELLRPVWAEGSPALVPPIHIVKSDSYLDGGTIMVVLADDHGDTLHGGFDGRMHPGLDSYPWHCFMGGDYPTVNGTREPNPGTRLLPLWGREERALVWQIGMGLENELSASERESLRVRQSPTGLVPWPRQREMWELLRAYDQREATLDALDRGAIESDAVTLAFFNLRSPLSISKVTRSEDSLNVIVRANGGVEWQIVLPSDSSRAIRGPSGYRHGVVVNFPIGTTYDRCMIALVEMALRSDAEQGNSTHLELERLLAIRKRRILADDANR